MNSDRKKSARENEYAEPSDPEACDVCGSRNLLEIRCKVICGNCRTILKSCADS